MMAGMMDRDAAHWSAIAADWIAWARKPGHDAFWYYREGLAALIGPGPARRSTSAAARDGCRGC